jgi:catechol 2,3-dioxygenase-like lactoylglutathione lyase family enzyme
MQLDHVVLWVDDPLRSVEFYETVVGLSGVRVDEFRAGKTMFPSVRISEHTIVDLMPRAAAAAINAMPGAAGTAGNRTNHVCLAMTEAEFHALHERLTTRRGQVGPSLERSFGARGLAPKAFYFQDPDGNVLEARYYPAAS